MRSSSKLQGEPQAGHPHRCAEGLARAVENMLPPAFGSSGNPTEAAKTFARFGVDRLTVVATGRLARLYVTQERNKDAIAALRGLATALPGDPLLCGEPLSIARELGDIVLIRDLSRSCAF